MKSLFVSVVLATMLASNAIADQNVVRPQGRYMLTSRVLTAFLDREAPAQVSGTLSVDVQGREATLSLQIAPICPPGRMCPRYIESRVINLPLVKADRDGCGGIIYTATKDLRPVDGPRQTLIRDNSQFRCPTPVMVPATEVVLREMGPRASFNEERVSTFTGTQLVRTPIPFIR